MKPVNEARVLRCKKILEKEIIRRNELPRGNPKAHAKEISDMLYIDKTIISLYEENQTLKYQSKLV